MPAADEQPRDGFEILCELEPPATPDLAGVHEQLDVLGDHCGRFLVPDSHLGRATVSSLAVGREVRRRGHRVTTCLNARDRNLMGLRRDLLTAAVHGLGDLLFVYGDAPRAGDRSSLTVRRMLEELSEGVGPPRTAWDVGVAADVRRPLPDFKRGADRVLTQLLFDPDAVERWCREVAFPGRIYAGVIALADEGMADRLEGTIPGLEVPAAVRRRLRDRPDAGARVAVEQVERLRSGGVVDGVHLVPAGQHGRMGAALAALGSAPSR